MKQIAILLAMLLLLSGCGGAAPASSSEGSSSEASSSETAASEAAAKAASEAAAKAASEAAASAASEAAAKAASEAAASEAAAQAAASEAAASEAAAKAASEAAASEAAASEAAAQAAAAEAAASEAAAQAAASEAAEKKAQKKSAGKSSDSYTSGDNFKSRTEASVIKLINKERERLGLGTLATDDDLTKAARIRSRELCEARKFAHKRPNGDDWSTVIKEDVPIKFISAGENLCTTEYNDPSQTYATSGSFWYTEWENSPPHYENIIREDYTHVGIGVYVIEKNGSIRAYATAEFAHLPE